MWARRTPSGSVHDRIDHDELLSEVRFPKPERSEASAYESVEDPASGYPIAGAAIRVRVVDGGAIRCTIGITGAAGHPFRPVEVEQLVREQSGVPAINEVREALAAVQTVGDVVADAEYRRAPRRRRGVQSYRDGVASGRAGS